MARVLIGWELGSNRGHIAGILPIARRLRQQGHEVIFALQRVDAVGLDHDPAIAVWQAPLWPGLLNSAKRPLTRPASTMGDILARLGLDQPGTLASLVSAWDRLFAAVQPDLVVADFAPAMLAAARGRIVSVLTGNGFVCPPADALSFPALAETPPAFDEGELLDIADADLVSAGRDALPGLPSLFAADHCLIAGFAELDPYASIRSTGHHAPVIGNWSHYVGGEGQEIFAYMFNQIPEDSPVWDGLAQAGHPVRLHMPSPSSAHLARFARAGFVVEAEPLPLDQIAARSRIAISHGGHGFVSSCLVAGLPQLVAWYDLEKIHHGRAISSAGLGDQANLVTATARDFATKLDALWQNEDVASRCAEAAPDFAARMENRAEDRIAEIAAAL